MKRITTESGAQYLIDGDRVMRTNPSAPMRGDGTWLTLYRPLKPMVGVPMMMLLLGLCEGHTYRKTTDVVSIEEVAQ